MYICMYLCMYIYIYMCVCVCTKVRQKGGLISFSASEKLKLDFPPSIAIPDPGKKKTPVLSMPGGSIHPRQQQEKASS